MSRAVFSGWMRLAFPRLCLLRAGGGKAKWQGCRLLSANISIVHWNLSSQLYDLDKNTNYR